MPIEAGSGRRGQCVRVCCDALSARGLAAASALLVAALTALVSLGTPPIASAADSAASAPPSAATAGAAHPARPAGVAWFDGDPSAAFDLAQRQRKPVFVYFGAVWCPPCQELKSTIFRRRDFLDRLTLYVPVYLDGDAPDAQRWADQFHVTGYPTVLILRSDRREIERITGGMDLSRYADVLNEGIAQVRPMADILAAIRGRPGSLALQECRILAYNGWQLDDAWMFSDDQPQALVQLANQLAQAAQRCPAGAQLERARLQLTVAGAFAGLEAAPLKAGKAPSVRLARWVRRTTPFFGDPLAAQMGDTLINLPQEYFLAARRLDPVEAAGLERQLVVVLDNLAADSRYSVPTQLFALTQKLAAVQALEPSGKVPVPMGNQAYARAALVLGQVHEAYARTAAVDAVLGLYEQLSDWDRAYALLVGELRSSATPFYYMSDLGDVEEQRGHPEAALDWYAHSYQAAQGAATRAQWGARYARALIRLRPRDDTAIRATTLQVLRELGQGASLQGRNRESLDRLFTQLHQWGSGGQHASALRDIRAQAREVCRANPASNGPPEGKRESCAQLLARI